MLGPPTFSWSNKYNDFINTIYYEEAVADDFPLLEPW